uniref:Uncharacterized protein n=1 Tax=Oryza barthii TaxID=65489 RepID=A0A0D3GP35_9ORYZ
MLPVVFDYVYYAIKLWVAAALPPRPRCHCLRSTPPLVVVLRGALLSMATSPADFSPLHRHGVVAVLSSRTAASQLVSSSSPFAHQQPRRPHWSSLAVQGPLPLLRASPPHLQVATVAALGWWSSYLHMATDIAVQAIGSATSPSSSSSMTHRQRRRIFLDYTSLFSGNCVLLQQFSLYAVLVPRPSWRPSLLVSSDIGVWFMVVPALPVRYWQHRRTRSSRVVPGSDKPCVTSRPSRFDYIGSSASSISTIASIASPSSSSARPRAPHSTAPHARSVARLLRHQLPDFGYIDHGYSTHGYLDHGSFTPYALATSTTAQRAIIRIEHSCRFILQSKCPRCLDFFHICNSSLSPLHILLYIPDPYTQYNQTVCLS